MLHKANGKNRTHGAANGGTAVIDQPEPDTRDARGGAVNNAE